MERNKDIWRQYLENTDQCNANTEYVDSAEDYKKNLTLKYVNKTLDILSPYAKGMPPFKNDHSVRHVRRTLQWSEVAKCGTAEDRERWVRDYHVNLDIHNEASAEIYLHETTDELITSRIVYALIKTHTYIGQVIRGECDKTVLNPLIDIQKKGLITSKELKNILYLLEHCIIGATKDGIWEKVEGEVENLIDEITATEYEEPDVGERIRKIFPNYPVSTYYPSSYKTIFKIADIWYPLAALKDFRKDDIDKIFKIIYESDLRTVKHITFYPLSRTLAYDYEGKITTNVYKQRILEHYLSSDKADTNVEIVLTQDGDTLQVDVKFSKAAEALTTFCVESERSGQFDYQKNINLVFDLFGYRRDKFDRLNNENSYLATMDDASNSTKLKLLDYVIGNRVLDVGSGSGVMIDALKNKFDESVRIFGTDISDTVLQKLLEKYPLNESNIYIKKHNFVDEPFTLPVSTIIFSSILHEVYSYTEFEGERYNINSVKMALSNAMMSLGVAGRILIRDGVRCDDLEMTGTIKCKDDSIIKSFGNFCRDFDQNRVYLAGFEVDAKNKEITANLDLLREFLYTLTWGDESYSQEVQEDFGYFTYKEYINYLEAIGLKITYSAKYTEQGYIDHLKDKVELVDFDWSDTPSTVFIVAEKI